MTPEQIAEAVELAKTIDEQAAPEAINSIATALLAEHERAEGLKYERNVAVADAAESVALLAESERDAARWRAVRKVLTIEPSALVEGEWWIANDEPLRGVCPATVDEAADRLIKENNNE